MGQIDEDFEAVDIDDISLLERYLAKAHYEEGNHNVVGFMIWLDSYPLWKCYTKDWMVLLGIHEKKLFIYMPLCEPQFFNEAILAAKKIFDRYQMPFVLSCFTKAAMDDVLTIFPQYVAQEYRDAADYVYLSEKLRSFSGKKLQKKRNHMNAFYKQYEGCYTYEAINQHNIPACIAFLENWHKEDNDDFLAYEKSGILRVFELWDNLPTRGGLLRIDGEVKAFVIGSRLSDRMCQMNVEKADEQIRGLYQAICKEFLSHEYLDCMYVNREDDMGMENIRQAKEAYAPEFMIMKYRLSEQMS